VNETHQEQLLISIAISCCMCISHNALHISNFPSFPLLMFALLVELEILVNVSSNQMSLVRKSTMYSDRSGLIFNNKKKKQKETTATDRPCSEEITSKSK
jgi:hypothetical protein